MSQTLTVAIDIDGKRDVFSVILSDHGSRDAPLVAAEVAGLLVWRIRDRVQGT